MTESSRAFLYRNVEDPEMGFCSEIVAVAHDPKYPTDSTTYRELQRIPWSAAPERVRQTLESGQPYGGIIDDLSATESEFLWIVKEDGVLSFQFFPVHLQGHWWGYISFDESHHIRQRTETEIDFLGTSGQLIANNLNRWQTEAVLRRQNKYEEALSNCSRTLLQIAHTEEEQRAILNQALEQLRQDLAKPLWSAN